MSTRSHSPVDFTLHIAQYLNGSDNTDYSLNAYKGFAEKSVVTDGDLHIPATFHQLEQLARTLHAKCLQLQSSCAALNSSLLDQKARYDEDIATVTKEKTDLEVTVAKKTSLVETYEHLVDKERNEHLEEVEQLNQRWADTEVDNEKLQRERDLYEAALKEQKNQLTVAVKQLDASMSQNKDLEEQLEARNAELRKLKDERKDGQEHGTHLKDLADMKRRWEMTEAQRLRCSGESAEKSRQLALLKSQRKEDLATIEQMGQHMKEAETRHQSDLRTIVQMEQQWESTRAEHSTLRREAEMARQEISAASQRALTAETKQEDLLRIARQYKQLSSTATVELAELRRSYDEVSKVLLHEIGRRECGPPKLPGEKQQYRYKYVDRRSSRSL